MGKKMDVSHLWILGSLVYCHVLEEKRKKLESIVDLRGINETSKVYMVYIIAHRETVIERYVEFEEDRALWKSLKHEQAIVQEEEQQEVQ